MRTRRASLLAAAAASLLTLTACAGQGAAGPAASSNPSGSAGGTETSPAAAADLTLTTADGKEVTLEAAPERIAVFDYAALDTLHALGLDDVVVATPTEFLPESLASFKDKPEMVNAGSLQEPDFDAVANANPDLIIASARSSDAVPELEKIAKVVTLTPDSADYLNSTQERALDLAGLFGKQNEAQAKIDKITALREEIEKVAPGAGKGLFVSVSGGKLSAYGPGKATRYGFIYDDLGAKPAAEITSEDRHGQAISFEFISEHNPSWMLVLDRDAAIGEQGQAAKEVLNNELVKGTDAAKKDRIVYVSAQEWYLVSGGLNTTQTMLEDIKQALSA